jgi:tetratricopeptide (TPR) repeat protein
MHKDLLITLIKNPYVTSQNDTPLLIELTKKYPYFHSAFTLLLINLQRTNKLELFDKYLHDSALKIADRKHVFNLLHKIETNENLTQGETAIDDNSVETEFSQKQTIEFQEEEDETPIVISNESINSNVIEKILQSDPKLLEIDETKTIDKKANIEAEQEVSAVEVDLTNKNSISDFNQKTIIERFIEENPSFAPRKLEPAEENPDISLDSVKEDDSLVSETLANIFEMQKLYDKAIEVYQKLILKFPEKSAYFASRIETLKKIVK